MSVDVVDNPLTLTFSEIWRQVENTPEITDNVALGNRIRFDTNKDDPLKRNISAADVPELVLVQETITGNLKQTSNTTQFTPTYAFLISTGDPRYTHYLAQVQWGCLSCLVRWFTNQALEWDGVHFIKAVQLLDDATSLRNPEQNRGLLGWSSIMRFEILMVFKTESLRRGV